MSLYPPLLPFETDILMWINGHHSPVLDAFMYMISNQGAWVPVVGALLYFLFAKKPWQEGVLVILTIALCIVICDQLSSQFAKPFFARYRPTHAEGFKDMMHVVYNYVGREYGFFSGHASNFFAVATVLSLVVRRRWHTLLLFFLVSCVAYSRMYLGVHFLSDILAGIVVGLTVGLLMSFLYKWLRKKFSPLWHKESSEVFEYGYKAWMGVLILFIPVLLSYSWQVAKIIARL